MWYFLLIRYMHYISTRLFKKCCSLSHFYTNYFLTVNCKNLRMNDISYFSRWFFLQCLCQTMFGWNLSSIKNVQNSILNFVYEWNRTAYVFKTFKANKLIQSSSVFKLNCLKKKTTKKHNTDYAKEILPVLNDRMVLITLGQVLKDA